MADKADITPLSAADLDTLFDAARDAAPVPPAALFERILADAEAEMPGPAAPAPGVAPAPRGWLGGLFAGIGGWPAAAGLAAAAVTGLTIGLVTPTTVDTLSGGYLGASDTLMEGMAVSYAGLLGDG